MLSNGRWVYPWVDATHKQRHVHKHTYLKINASHGLIFSVSILDNWETNNTSDDNSDGNVGNLYRWSNLER